MARKDRRGGVPDLDPFGTNDPAWERYYGVSWLRRIASLRSLREGKRPPRGEMLSAMLVGVVVLVIAVGAITLVFWLLAQLID